MCTVISEVGALHLFGRTLDLEYSYNECVTITPRGYDFKFLHEQVIPNFALIGASCVVNDVPLYYDAMNEYGLCMAALNFPDFAHYNEVRSGLINVASYELIPFVLRQCKDCASAVSLLKRVNITDDSFSSELPRTPLHWIIADESECYTLEPLANGLQITQNPYRVLTNAPEFSFHIINLCNYMSLDSFSPRNTLSKEVALNIYSRGMGALGLPGDFSSVSRFVRAFFAKNHTSAHGDEINRAFNILNTVFVPSGCIKTNTGQDVCTVYTSCACSDNGNYYFQAYGCKRICCVRINDVNLNAATLFSYSMKQGSEFKFLN